MDSVLLVRQPALARDSVLVARDCARIWHRHFPLPPSHE